MSENIIYNFPTISFTEVIKAQTNPTAARIEEFYDLMGDVTAKKMKADGVEIRWLLQPTIWHNDKQVREPISMKQFFENKDQENKNFYCIAVLLTSNGMPHMIWMSADGVTRALHPFRGYRFQVSGDIRGDGDYGSGAVLGLGNILKAKYENENGGTWGYQSNSSYEHMGEAVLTEMVQSALWKASQYAGCYRTFVEPNTTGGNGENAMSIFMNLTINLLKNGLRR